MKPYPGSAPKGDDGRYAESRFHGKVPHQRLSFSWFRRRRAHVCRSTACLPGFTP